MVRKICATASAWAKIFSPVSSVCVASRGSANARARAKARRRGHDRLHADVFTRAAEKGWKFVPPAAADVMKIHLLLNQDSRDTVLILAKALYADKANHWFQ